MEESVKNTEPINRYIIQPKWIRRSDNSVRHNAFWPNNNGEVSVYRTIDLSEIEIFEIGQHYFADYFGKKLLGRAELLVSDVTKHGPKIKSCPKPHPRHANIYDFPEGKDRIIAMQIAESASLHLVDKIDIDRNH